MSGTNIRNTRKRATTAATLTPTTKPMPGVTGTGELVVDATKG